MLGMVERASAKTSSFIIRLFVEITARSLSRYACESKNSLRSMLLMSEHICRPQFTSVFRRYNQTGYSSFKGSPICSIILHDICFTRLLLRKRYLHNWNFWPLRVLLQQNFNGLL
jgi:hypothetical protein